MKNIKVTFYGNEDFEGNDFTCVFRTEHSLKNFVETYQYAPGYCVFYYDIFEDNCLENWPVITNSMGGFIKLIKGLFPDLSLREIKHLTNKNNLL